MRKAVALLVVVAFAALLAPWIASHDPLAQLDIVQLRNQPPSFSHLLGTDAFARDLFSRLLFGARTSLFVSVCATMLALIIGLAWGGAAILLQEWFGEALMALADVLRSIPRLLLYLSIIAAAGHLGAPGVAVLLGVTSWPATSRVVYQLLRELRGRSFIESARSLGVPPAQTVLRHLVPHLAGPLSAIAALLFADMLAVEASLSFLGLGVRAPVPSWGNMLQDALPYLRSAWWVAAAPCAMFVTTVLAVARIADGIADRAGTHSRVPVRPGDVPPAASARQRVSGPVMRSAPDATSRTNDGSR